MIKWLKQPHWVRWDGKNGHAGVYYDPFWAVNASVTVNGNDLGVAFQLVFFGGYINFWRNIDAA